MRTSRKVVTGLLAGAVVVAITIPGIVSVFAIPDEGELFSSQNIYIDIELPESSEQGAGQLYRADDRINIYTDDGEAPNGSVLVPALASVEVGFLVQGVDLEDVMRSVEFTLDGELTVTGTTPNASGSWMGDHPLVAGDEVGAQLLNRGGNFFGIQFIGAVDVARAEALDDFDAPEDGEGGVVSAIMRAFVKIAVNYESYEGQTRATSNGIDAADAIELEIGIFENEDDDDNGVPDVSQLFEGNGQTEPTSVGGTTVKTSWVGMGLPTRGFVFDSVQIADTLTVGGGTLFIDVEAPGLATLLNTIRRDGSFTTGNPDVTRQDILDAADARLLEGVLILTRSNSTNSLTEGDNPSAAFDLDTDDPAGVFMLITILLSISDGMDPATFTYTVLDELPDDRDSRGGLEYLITLELSGDAIADNLEDAQTDNDEIYAYRFATDVTVDMEDLLNTTPEDGVWNDVEDDGSSFGFGEGMRTALPVAPADVSSMTIFLATGSGIIGTSVTPRAGGAVGGGGSDGICFIATAAYGTPLADEIGVLRGLRDSYMLNNMVGTAFVDTYYRLSPPVADVVAHNAVAKALVRTLLVPVLMLSGFALAMPGASAALLLVALAFAGYRVRKSVTRS